MAVLLAACAGATDALAFFGLEGLCGHRDRQPGHGRYGIATGNLSLVRPTVTAWPARWSARSPGSGSCAGQAPRTGC
jgi:hypothetical protein